MRYIGKPEPTEYPAYSKIYFDLIQDDGQILDHLRQNFIRIKAFVNGLPNEKLTHRYAPDKWTIREILVHIIDDERIFCYRALRYARNDATVLPGFDQDLFAKYSNANTRSLQSIFDEYETIRNSTISLFQNLPEESLLMRGTVLDEDGRVSHDRTVRALVYHIAGHELWHFNIIKERYL